MAHSAYSRLRDGGIGAGMNVLIGCEISGMVRDAFLARGHNAFSCDLQASDHFKHIQCDIFHVIGHPRSYIDADKWDLIICHPPCTALAVSGNAHYAAGKPHYQKRVEAIQWTSSLWNWARRYSHRVCFENPRGVLGTMSTMSKATQSIQPYEFGHDASKTTDLWLSNLPKLKPTKRIKGRIVDGKERWSNQTDSGQNRLGPSPDRGQIRAQTYPGIAEAMADQWDF